MNGSTLLIVFLIINWPLEIARCQDENEETIKICTQDWQDSRKAGWENCLSLQQYINSSTSRSEGIIFRLLPGRHTLNGTDRLMISGTNFTMVSDGDSDTTLDCSGSDSRHNVVFSSIDNGSVQINSTNIIGCQFYFSDIYDIIIYGGSFRGARDPGITVNRAGSVVIRGWNCSDCDGGCLSLAHTTLYLSSSNFTSNSNTITTVNAPLNIIECLFGNNQGELGGVINARFARVNITCSTFTNNMATGSGGVIYVNHSSVLLTSSSFKSNSARLHGGVFFLMNANIDMLLSDLSNNTALLLGGAGLIRNGALSSISETNFLGNSAAGQSNFVTLCNTDINRISPQDEALLRSRPQDSDGCTPYDGNITRYQNCCPSTCNFGEYKSSYVGGNN